ncbi:hypothetical protein Mucpa_6055 [Mucilaginibacter paludis DSM 18603]|uniref:Uncharacterized protein n=1 Tax=Mucilaginibacter paludis DSM 18603 TaxID=714943 RepID=H1YCC2_9SPHI|nr:hypothetical protein Mucpa_6055 [Mucilaginibacter paludis DSM 18603]
MWCYLTNKLNSIGALFIRLQLGFLISFQPKVFKHLLLCPANRYTYIGNKHHTSGVWCYLTNKLNSVGALFYQVPTGLFNFFSVIAFFRELPIIIGW